MLQTSPPDQPTAADCCLLFYSTTFIARTYKVYRTFSKTSYKHIRIFMDESEARQWLLSRIS